MTAHRLLEQTLSLAYRLSSYLALNVLEDAAILAVIFS